MPDLYPIDNQIGINFLSGGLSVFDTAGVRLYKILTRPAKNSRGHLSYF
jgi:hypothetical protein